MSIWIAELRYTGAQKRIRWIIGGSIALLAVSAAIWSAFDCAQIAYGYVAGYTFEALFFLSILLCIVGIPFLPFWKTRSTGAVFVLSGFLLYGVFLSTVEVLKKLDRVAWMHEPPMQSFGPDQPASLVIYYRPGTTGNQISDFVENKLENYPSKVHDGKDYPDFVSEYLGLLPSQANGYDASAITFKAGSKGPAVDASFVMIQSDARVLRIFRDTSPNDIHLPKSEQAPSLSEPKALRSR